MLTSVAGDLAITQVVDGPKGVHVKMPKTIFKERQGTDRQE
jgi:acetamidase/formamidase